MKKTMLISVIVAMSALALWIGGVALWKYKISYSEKIIEITNSVPTKDESGYYRVYAWVLNEKCEKIEQRTFQNKDDFWFFKFNSADVQGQFVHGAKYKIGETGIRVPFFSWFENIVSVKDYSCE